MTTIYLRPLNGLCNRMRTLASGRALAAATGAQCVVFWDVNGDLGARYEDLFVPGDDGFRLINVAPWASVGQIAQIVLFGETARIKGVPLGWVTRLALAGRIHRQVRPETFTPAELEALARQSGRMLITSWWSFYGGTDVDFSFFRPHPAAQIEIEAISARFNDSTIGVHIRRSDNANAIRYSPTSAFEGAMAQAIQADPRVSFFLTTDCPTTEATFAERFGKRVITRGRRISRDSVEGMRDAVVDLFVLSRTRRIFGSYYSTFSETAASLGRITWVTVTHDADLRCNSAVLVIPE